MGDEQDRVVSLIGEAMTHVRHSQQMRATYLNFYLVFYAAAAGFVAVVVTNLHEQAPLAPDAVALGVATIAWISGVLTMFRMESWSAHVWHNIIAARRLRTRLSPRAFFSRVFPGDDLYASRGQFRLPPIHPLKSVDTAVTLAVSGLASAPWFLAYTPAKLWAALMGFAFIVVPLKLLDTWQRRIEAQHQVCCLDEFSASPSPGDDDASQ